MADAAHLLSMEGVCKRVPDAADRWLFEAVALGLHRGEFVAVLGESGVGKSTLLHIVAGLDRKDGGTLCFAGQDLDALDDDARTLLRRRQMGFIFQAFHLIPQLTVAENIALPWRLNALPRKGLPERVRKLARFLGIDHRLEAWPRELSGGEMQRVAVARATLHDPALILADEPTGSLDPDSAGQVLELLRDAGQRAGSAILMVTHSDVAAACAQRRFRLERRGLRQL
ncbi:ABC transporter ATP-binding protein [Acidithiobacillus caldus]|nr:ABC transporter ATP-binding protein [Acidithiobacillus caldus]